MRASGHERPEDRLVRAARARHEARLEAHRAAAPIVLARIVGAGASTLLLLAGVLWAADGWPAVPAGPLVFGVVLFGMVSLGMARFAEPPFSASLAFGAALGGACASAWWLADVLLPDVHDVVRLGIGSGVGFLSSFVVLAAFVRWRARGRRP